MGSRLLGPSFQVAMDHAMIVHMLNPLQDLIEEACSIRLRESFQRLSMTKRAQSTTSTKIQEHIHIPGCQAGTHLESTASWANYGQLLPF